MVRKHKSTIYTVCMMFGEETDDVEDLVQETLINLWRGFAKFEGRSQEKTWIWRVAMNTCISQERKQKARKGRGLPSMPSASRDRLMSNPSKRTARCVCSMTAFTSWRSSTVPSCSSGLKTSRMRKSVTSWASLPRTSASGWFAYVRN